MNGVTIFDTIPATIEVMDSFFFINIYSYSVSNGIYITNNY